MCQKAQLNNCWILCVFLPCFHPVFQLFASSRLKHRTLKKVTNSRGPLQTSKGLASPPPPALPPPQARQRQFPLPAPPFPILRQPPGEVPPQSPAGNATQSLLTSQGSFASALDVQDGKRRQRQKLLPQIKEQHRCCLVLQQLMLCCQLLDKIICHHVQQTNNMTLLTRT